jgi:DNA-directed RNA polymerase subunit RPC12/RpoP
MTVKPRSLAAEHSSVSQATGEIPRCPKCGARLRDDASWCSLCYADLRPPPPVVTSERRDPDRQGSAPKHAGRHARHAAQPGPAVPDPAPAIDPLTAPLAVLEADPYAAAAGSSEPTAGAAPAGETAPTWPCLTCGSVVPISEPACPHCGEVFLAAARRDDGSLRRLSSNGSKAAIMVGGSLGLMLVLLAAMYLFGAIF